MLSMSFFSFDEHDSIKMYEPNSHTIVFYCAQMGNSVCNCSRQGKSEISEIVLDGVLEKAEVRS